MALRTMTLAVRWGGVGADPPVGGDLLRGDVWARGPTHTWKGAREKGPKRRGEVRGAVGVTSASRLGRGERWSRSGSRSPGGGRKVVQGERGGAQCRPVASFQLGEGGDGGWGARMRDMRVGLECGRAVAWCGNRKQAGRIREMRDDWGDAKKRTGVSTIKRRREGVRGRVRP